MNNKERVINVVNSPLGFFALALLIIEGFLGIVVIGSGETLDSKAKLIGMFMAAGAFVLVVIIVAFMVWKKPESLTLEGKDWAERAKMYKIWSDESKPTIKRAISKTKQKESIPITKKEISKSKQKES